MLKKIFKITAACLALLFGAILSISLLLWIYEEELGAKVVEQLQSLENLDLRIEDQTFSLWSSLPNVSYDLQKVEIYDPEGTLLLRADVLGLRMRLSSLWRQELSLENILIKNGEVHLDIDKTGTSKWNQILSSGSYEKDSYFKTLSLDYTQLEDIRFYYRDQLNQIQGQLSIRNVLLKMDKSLEGMHGSVEGHSICDHIVIKKDTICHDLEIRKKLKLDYSTQILQWNIVSQKLLIAKNEFILSSNWKSENMEDFRLDLQSKGGNLASLTRLISSFGLYIPALNTQGKYHCHIEMASDRKRKDKLGLSSIWSIQDASIQHIDNQERIDDLNMYGSIHWSDLSSMESINITVDSFNLANSDLRFQGSLSMEHWDKMKIKYEGAGAVSLPSILSLANTNVLNLERGILSCKKLEGEVQRSHSSWQLRALQADLDLSHMNGTFNQAQFETDRIQVHCTNNQIILDSSHWKILDREVTLSGSIPDLKEQFQSNQWAINLKGRFEEINYNDIVQLLNSEAAPEVNTSDDSDNKHRPSYRIALDLEGKHFYYNDLDCKMAEALLDIYPDKMDYDLHTEVFQGRLKAKGTYNFSHTEEELFLKLETYDTRIEEILENFNNFDQKVITHKNIQGALNSRNTIRIFWDEKGSVNLDNLEVYSDIEIKNGALLGLTMLYDFSNYIKLRDLMDIRFSNMHNYLEISNRKIHIPQMFIQSNALNLSVAGSHTFDHQIDYCFKLNAAQILLNKLKKYEGDKKPLPAKKTGMFNVYYCMDGSAESYMIKNDRKWAQAKFEESKIQKSVIFEELKRNFPMSQDKSLEPEEWMDIDSKSIKNYAQPVIGETVEDEFIDGF